MLSAIRFCAFLAVTFATTSLAGPVAVRDVELSPAITDRSLIPLIELGSYDLTTSYVNDVILNIGASQIDGGLAETFHLEVVCIDCQTWGSATVTTAGVDKNEDLIGEIIEFFEHPIDTIVEAFEMDIKVSFEDVGGHFEFDILASDTLSYSLPIFVSETLAGSAISEDVTFGMVLFIDLVFSLTAEVELEAGFDFAFPEGAYITVNPLVGNIVDHGFTGGEAQSLPIIVTSGSATFKAALRVRVQGGTTVDCFGTGFDFELGVYADLVEYVATLDTTPSCELAVTETLDCNIGAFAHAVAEIDYKTFGINGPAAVTTLLDIPLPSLCLTRPADASFTLAFPSATGTAAMSGSLSVPYPIVSGTGFPASASSPYVSGGVSAPNTTPAFLPTITSAAIYPSATGTGIVAPYPSMSGSYNSTVVRGSSAITTSVALTTSTVYSSTEITITSCSSTVLHCPASAASEFTVTSSVILYTTICPVGAALPTTLAISKPSPSTISPSATISSSQAMVTNTVSYSKFTPCASPSVETIYTPTFNNPVYSMPTATSFPVANPNWTMSASFVQPRPSNVAAVEGSISASATAIVQYTISASVGFSSTHSVPSKSTATTQYTITTQGLGSATSVVPTAGSNVSPVISGGPTPISNSSVLATGTGVAPKPTYTPLVPFTGEAGPLTGPSVAGLVGVIFGAVLML